VVPTEVSLSKLEVFISSGNSSVCLVSSIRFYRQLCKDILISSECLRIFRGSLDMESLFLINARRPLSTVFNRLIVLDLELFTTRDALHQLLLKVDNLEMLRTSTYVGITNDTIILLTDLELNLSFAVFYHAYCPPENEDEEWESSVELDPIQPDVLLDFRDMLLSKNLSIDLSKIQFVLQEGETLETLEALDTGFTFLRMCEDDFEGCSSPELHDPEIKRYLGIDF